MKFRKILITGFAILIANISYSQQDSISLKKVIANTKISGQWFLNYLYDEDAQMNSFSLKRGYFTFKTKLSDVFLVRYTQDITLDKEGSDAGNIEMRLKYLYLKTKLKNIAFLKHSYIEFGLVHRPWLDFETSINKYRVQGKMFVERSKIINSADFGATFSGLIGGKIDKEYQKNINKKYPGKYGSYSIGVYNGGGYHAIEYNSNKTIEGRLSLRPLPKKIPGMQFSYSFAAGKANLADTIPDFLMNLFMFSSESKFHVINLQYYWGTGDKSGKYINEFNRSYNNDGYSAFAEIKIPKTKFTLFGRYDLFNSHQTDEIYSTNTTILGLAYKFLNNKILFDYQKKQLYNNTIETYEIALEISF